MFIAVLKFQPDGTLSVISVFVASKVPAFVIVIVKSTVSPAFTVALCPAAKAFVKAKSKSWSTRTSPWSWSSSSCPATVPSSSIWSSSLSVLSPVPLPSILSGVESISSPESELISAQFKILVPMKLESTTKRIFTLTVSPAARLGITYVESAFQSPTLPVWADVL